MKIAELPLFDRRVVRRMTDIELEVEREFLRDTCSRKPSSERMLRFGEIHDEISHRASKRQFKPRKMAKIRARLAQELAEDENRPDRQSEI